MQIERILGICAHPSIYHLLSAVASGAASQKIHLPTLKVVANEKEGVGKVANDRNWSRTAAFEVCLPFNFAVVFEFPPQ